VILRYAVAVFLRGPALLWRGVKIVVALMIFIVLVGNFGFHTDRDAGYRTIDPSSELCRASFEQPWSILSQSNVRNDEMRALEAGQHTQAQLAAIAQSLLSQRGSAAMMIAQSAPGPGDWNLRLRCAIQRHTVKWSFRYAANARALIEPRRKAQPTYDLAFLEFKENGDPYPLADANGDDYSALALSKMKSVGQIEALVKHLWKYTGDNYVLVFIHGWRHDASVGDGNVADLRVYAARTAQHLSHRCEIEGRHCGAHVMAVFVGWRGARVDERYLTQKFGFLGEQFGTIAAIPTLFDRKPVSEAIAPAVVSALRAIDKNVERDKGDQVIVFGHSLGGNMLMTGLKDAFVKLVERRPLPHEGGGEVSQAKSPVGDLVVLINPASEAGKWIEIQRVMWRKLAMLDDDDVAGDTTAESKRFFAPTQRPLLVSATAALAWPPGGIRPKDCSEREKEKAAGRESVVGRQIDKANALLNNGLDYDFATHDLFPAFKGDFRPLGDRFERAANRTASNMKWDACLETEDAVFSPLATAERGLAALLRNMPFMDTNAEETHTIGHVDPARNVAGTLKSNLVSWRPFGTTHEISRGDRNGDWASDNPYCNGAPAAGALAKKDTSTPYFRTAGASLCDCAASTGWLSRARAALQGQGGVYWDSARLGPPVDGLHNPPALRFVHGFENAGISAITRANDPFWNIRAFDDALAKHDGYMLSSFICAMNSLVMDDIIDQPPPAAPLRSEAQPEAAAPATPAPVATQPAPAPPQHPAR
jgi:hypothetical protein